jgi:diadenosine tetraphosphatase ApaH/serine/threonine PP2A family protein phosphatase
MRALVVSDIHANIEAFEAVLSDSEGDRDAVICLGDLVGYGPDPDACVELASRVCDETLAGNHDLAACGRMDTSSFSAHAKAAMDWTQSHLSAGTVEFLESLPVYAERRGLALSHGSPADPVWGYILSSDDAEEAFRALTLPVCLFGHTHVPSAFIWIPGEPARISIEYGEPGRILRPGNSPVLLNPGSVGFPRDAADAHASDSERRAAARYAIFDDRAGTWEFKRVEYDLRATARRMRKAGLW